MRTDCLFFLRTSRWLKSWIKIATPTDKRDSRTSKLIQHEVEKDKLVILVWWIPKMFQLTNFPPQLKGVFKSEVKSLILSKIDPPELKFTTYTDDFLPTNKVWRYDYFFNFSILSSVRLVVLKAHKQRKLRLLNK